MFGVLYLYYFVELGSEVLLPLFISVKNVLFDTCQGVSSVASTSLRVCCNTMDSDSYDI